MSLATPATSVTQMTTNSVTGRSDTFQDLPLISRQVKLNIMELEHSDKQIINELVYRFCRILTRKRTSDVECRVLIIDFIGAVNPIRLGIILKRDSSRLRKVRIIRQCKINSTFLTLNAYINRDVHMMQPKLIVIYQDEFFITKTLKLLEKFLPNSKSQVVLVVPKLNRSERDVLHLMPNNQILRCDFVVSRNEIGPAPPDYASASYQKYLNQVYFSRFTKNKNIPDRVEGLLTDEGLHLTIPMRPPPIIKAPTQERNNLALPSNTKKIKLEL